MATVTGLTAAKMLEIEAASIVDGRLDSGELILIQHDGDEINVGPVSGPQGPPGPAGPQSVGIPGEVKLWPGNVLPDLEDYGKWVWADGAVYVVAEHPLAAVHIAAQWRTFDGASDPGPSNFRVPDLRGLVGAGMDAMPGGVRANRMTRAVAIIIASKSGKETHPITVPEMPSHSHQSGGGHQHAPHGANNQFAVTANVGEGVLGDLNSPAGIPPTLYREAATAFSDIPSLNPTGGNNAHENVQPTVFVPYIVYLDVV
jgi:microcystin-dependent protein